MKRISQAVKFTFERRNVSIDENVAAFTDGFAKAKQDQWLAFRRKIKAVDAPESFRDVTSHIEKFLRSVVQAIVLKKSDLGYWKSPDRWEAN